MLKKSKLIVSCILMIAMCASMLIGCTVTKETEGESKTSGTTAQSTSQGTEIKPYASDKVVELTWLMRDDEQNPLNVNGTFFDDIEKLTGVRIKATPVIPDALDERLNLAVASKNLTDIVQGDEADFFLRYGQDGAFIPLDDLIDKYAPNIKQHLNDPVYSEAKYWSRALDGKQYVVPTLRPEPDFSKHLMIRQDWLDKLNLKMPNNVEEFYAVLKEFKANDLAGGGKTIPFSSMGSDMQQFMILFDVDDDFFIENGEVKYGPADPRYKQALEWLNKFYKEGSMHKEVFSLSEDQYYEDVYGGNVGVGYNSLGRLPKANKALSQKFPDAGYKFTLLVPMESITRQRRTNAESVVEQPNAISYSCKYPEVAIKLLDFFFTYDATMLCSFGLPMREGIKGAGAFEVVSDINQVPKEYIQAKEEFGNKDTIFIKAIVEDPVKQLLQYGYFERQTPHRGGSSFNREVIDMSQPPPQNDERMVAIKTIRQTCPISFDLTKSSLGLADFTFYKFTADESKRAGELLGPIESLVEEYKAKFIVGTEPLSNWDSVYMEKLKKLNIDELIKIYNDGYKRYIQMK